MMSERLPYYAVQSRELFDLLVGPAIEALRGRKTLCIVPDGPLWDVPFHCLQGGQGRWLLQDFEEQWANPALRETLLEVIRRTESEPSLLGASSHLPGIARKPGGTSR